MKIADLKARKRPAISSAIELATSYDFDDHSASK
jgi:hypothetical protein